MNYTVQAVSKVNLFLRVTGTLPGGFHSIETLFVPVPDIFDTLHIEVDPDMPQEIELITERPEIPADRRNLIWRVCEEYFRITGLCRKLRIRLEKRIPVAAGMGGGSSDAGTMLRFLQEKFGTLPDGGKALALSIGSDVPYFLNPVPSVGRGRGELLEPIPDLPVPKIRINAPGFPVSAKWAYQAWKEDPSDHRTLEELLSALRNRDWIQTGKLLRNDLAAAIRRKFPILSLIEEKFRSQGFPGVQITGSGPTVYAIENVK